MSIYTHTLFCTSVHTVINIGFITWHDFEKKEISIILGFQQLLNNKIINDRISRLSKEIKIG